jgi:hypothetical protein
MDGPTLGDMAVEPTATGQYFAVRRLSTPDRASTGSTDPAVTPESGTLPPGGAGTPPGGTWSWAAEPYSSPGQAVAGGYSAPDNAAGGSPGGVPGSARSNNAPGNTPGNGPSTNTPASARSGNAAGNGPPDGVAARVAHGNGPGGGGRPAGSGEPRGGQRDSDLPPAANQHGSGGPDRSATGTTRAAADTDAPARAATSDESDYDISDHRSDRKQSNSGRGKGADD